MQLQFNNMRLVAEVLNQRGDLERTLTALEFCSVLSGDTETLRRAMSANSREEGLKILHDAYIKNAGELIREGETIFFDLEEDK